MKHFEIVELADAGREAEWQTYVKSAPHASVYHALEWRDVLLRAFGHRSWYLMAQDDGETRGVLPLVEMKSSLFGHFFVSLPFLDYGGILADTPEYEAALATAAAGLAAQRGAHHVELRQSFAAARCAEVGWAGWKLRQHKAALVIPLNADPDTHWSGLSSRLRGKVRKAEKSGATFSVGMTEGLDDFYRVFSLNMRDLGTPVYSPAFFQNVLRFAKDAAVLLVHREGRPVAGAIALRSGERLELPWICSDYSQSSFSVNEYLYWNAIQWACRSCARELDLGRCSIDGGTFRFKIQWNPEVRPLFWYYWLASGIELPELGPDNPKYALAVRCWKTMPLALANRLGPWIVRNIP
ncbi:FemAB family PEP-CTERM system-associated protein [Bradyrhizobium sp. KBS0727]|jgi:serine/alanine adding enzyme|uniref:FemAB family XrtA/PEP-CTERM system-associated protein n=1 Tax=unclassified Bradyrhizobium TaxID=2631580 RepID=UPI00110D679C|nr:MULTISPECIES: FemAB family XrtA/PEP-CTERM system-associated protein [unclassified Bradyrhizobium]QDW40661.1 FemAB family PEP-CTERM system-associated protein [Bradyrhizobium sp. KBS0725]QDW47266.1 FemAB family PEP-CTERM system-associated protein [Bradyrhizobium sp. KBS0727]